MNESEKLMNARCRLMTREPWYGHIAMSMTWVPSDMAWLPEPSRTMGVCIVNAGEIRCIYYPPFVDRLTLRELFAVIQHEIEHIVRCHCLRVGSRIHEAWNIAADMTVNGRRTAPRIGYQEPSTNEVIIPMKSEIVWIPDDWPDNESAESYYARIEKNMKSSHVCASCGRPVSAPGQGKKGKGKGKGKDKDEEGEGNGNGQGQGDKGDQEGGGGGSHTCPQCGQEDDGTYRCGQFRGKALDNHDIWQQTEVSQDEARQIVKDMVDQATEKCQGHAPGHLQEAIKALGKPVVRWRELLRRYLGNHVGNRRTTFSRANRRNDAFGIPGISHHAACTVNAIIDTSGSVGTQELQQFFGELEAISHRANLYVLQWDHAYQGYDRYRRGDWKKFKVHGRGGTDMAAPVEWLVTNKLVGDCTVMLTDGYCNWASPKSFPMITVITSGADQTKGPGWGHEVRMPKG